MSRIHVHCISSKVYKFYNLFMAICLTTSKKRILEQDFGDSSLYIMTNLEVKMVILANFHWSSRYLYLCRKTDKPTDLPRTPLQYYDMWYCKSNDLDLYFKVKWGQNPIFHAFLTHFLHKKSMYPSNCTNFKSFT